MQNRASTFLIMNLIIIFFGLLFYLHYQISHCYSKTITFFNTERPVVEWIDKRYCKNFTLISKRVSRHDPKHYVDIHVHTLATLNNSLLLDFYFFKFVSNRYQPSFLELHFKFCDMLEHDPLIGLSLRNAFAGRLCPFPPGEYHLSNMSMSYVPKDFPYNKGRIYCNASLNVNGVTEAIASGHIDTEVKSVQIRKNYNP